MSSARKLIEQRISARATERVDEALTILPGTDLGNISHNILTLAYEVEQQLMLADKLITGMGGPVGITLDKDLTAAVAANHRLEAAGHQLVTDVTRIARRY